MSFEKLAQKMAGHPEVQTLEKERHAQADRKDWHESFLALVYPHWYGPLVKMAHRAGIESATHGIVHGLPPGAEGIAKALPARDWLIGELITVTTAVAAGVQVAYIFGGDENDGTLVRIAGTRDGDRTTFLPEHTKQWTGPRERLLDAAEADVQDAAQLFGPLLVDAYEAKAARLEREEKARKEAERQAAEEAAARESEAEANRKKLQEAALEESRRLEAETGAAGALDEKPE